MWKLSTVCNITYRDFQVQIQDALKKNSRRRLAIWGAGVRGMLAGILLESAGIKDFCFIDSAIDRIGTRISGHEVKAFEKLDKEDLYILVSMEYQEVVIEKLKRQGLKEYIDYYCLKSEIDDFFIEKLKSNWDTDILVLGTSYCFNLPIDEIKEMSLAQILERQMDKRVKVLGMSSVGMRSFYRTFQIEFNKNPQLKKVVLLINWKDLTSYNHLLPRTQKPQLTRMMINYTEELGYSEIKEDLEEDLKLALQRSQNYKVENQYSPQNVEDNLKNDVRIEYLKISELEKLDKQAEEYIFLEKLLADSYLKNVKTYLIIEPHNYELIIESLGKKVCTIYEEKFNFLREIAMKYKVKIVDGSRLLDKNNFVATRTVSDALRIKGRQKFAEFIEDIVRDEGE